MRGWTKDSQRAVFQPVMLAAIVANVYFSLGIAGAHHDRKPSTCTWSVLPAMTAGLWAGFKLYGKLDDVTFRRVILMLLLISGLGLIAAQPIFSAGPGHAQASGAPFRPKARPLPPPAAEARPQISRMMTCFTR